MKKSQLRNIIRDVIKEQSTSQAYHITGNICNGIGTYATWLENNTPPSFTHQSGGYAPTTYTFSGATWNNGNSVPQIGDYFVAMGGWVFKIHNITPVTSSQNYNLQPYTQSDTNFCVSYWKCMPGGNCSGPNAYSPSPASGGINIHNMYATNPNWYGTPSACNNNCQSYPPPPPATTCSSELGFSVLKPLNQAGQTQPGIQNYNPTPTQAECVMDYFRFNESTQQIELQGCKHGFAGQMSYTLNGPHGHMGTLHNSSGTQYTTIPMVPGNYTATVECQYTSNPDSHTICLKTNPQGRFTYCDTRISPDDRGPSGPSEPTDPNLGAKIEPVDIEPVEPIKLANILKKEP